VPIKHKLHWYSVDCEHHSDRRRRFYSSLEKARRVFQVADTFNLTLEEIESLARNSYRASFKKGGAKAKVLEHFEHEAAHLQAELFGSRKGRSSNE
jgi:hypothetical protein